LAELSNPFDDPDGSFLVLVNHEDQHCIWPAFAELPSGWTVAQDAAGRAEALAYVERNWTDMRPRSLRERARDGAA
jgi:MbtH protein